MKENDVWVVAIIILIASIPAIVFYLRKVWPIKRKISSDLKRLEKLVNRQTNNLKKVP